MQLSVIVPCYDIERHVDRCLTSLRDQELGPEAYEIIVVDDGSTDSTPRAIQAHAETDARIVVVRQENQGLSAARNAGLDRARGEFVYFVDGDDYVAGGSLRPVVEAMDELELDLAWVHSQWLGPDEDAAPASRRADSPEMGVISGMRYWIEHDWITNVWQYMLRRSFLERTGVRFEPGMVVEDRPFTYNVLVEAERVTTVEQDVYRYVYRPGSIMRDASVDGTRKVLAGLRRSIASLDELYERKVGEGVTDPAFRSKLVALQGNMGFFLITRVIRSSVGLRSTLGETLAWLQAAGHFPLRGFPDREHGGLHYRILTGIYNRRPLLYPFAAVAGTAYRARARWADRSTEA